MKLIKNLSVQKKLFLGILTISIFIIIVITSTAMVNTYDTMREQLIYNRRMSIGWLRERLELELSDYQEQFYTFEVNQNYRNIIQGWCLQGEELDYESRWQLITAMNEAVSMDSSLNSMEIYNLNRKEVLVAERSGASLQLSDTGPELWNERQKDMQSNLVFLRTDKEILILHQMHRFADKEPYALIVMHVRPYELQDILEDIKMTTDETVLILNDEKQLIEADYGEENQMKFAEIQSVAEHMKESDKTEFLSDGNFWFYCEVDGAKLRVLLSVPDHVIWESLKGTLLAALFAGCIAVFFSVAGAILFSRVFSKPIIRLSDKMRHFTLGDLQKSGEEKIESERFAAGNKNEITILQGSFDIMVERNQKLIAQEYQKELEKREAQIHALQAQINPHFMYNVMQVIGGMALKKKAPEIYRVTTALGDLMRYCLNFSREMVTLKEELHYLQSYCMLQNERFNGRIKLEIEVDEFLQQILIPKLILQPILENSFHHGLASKSGDWMLAVRGERVVAQEGQVDVLVLTVTDNGKGIEKERLEQIRENLKRDAQSALKSDAHIGLGNVDARIRLMYPEGGYGVTIDSQEGRGTTVKIRMEINPETVEAEDGKI